MIGPDLSIELFHGQPRLTIVNETDITWPEEPAETGGPEYLYNEGDYWNKWDEGYTYGFHVLTKQDKYLEIVLLPSPDGDVLSEGAFVTADLVDLTGYDNLKVEWSSNDSYHPARQWALVVSDVKMNNYLTYDLREIEDAASYDKRSILTADISSLTGSYYIRLHTLTHLGDIAATYYFHKVWLEEGV